MPIKLIDQVNHKTTPAHAMAPTSSGRVECSGAQFLMPPTPDPNTPFNVGASDSTAPACPRARTGLAPPQTMMSVLQVGRCQPHTPALRGVPEAYWPFCMRLNPFLRTVSGTRPASTSIQYLPVSSPQARCESGSFESYSSTSHDPELLCTSVV